MRISILIVISLFLCSSKKQAITIHAYQKLMDQAQSLLIEKQTLIEEQFTRIAASKRAKVMAIIFPELMRYRFLQNLLETKALELSYVQMGTKEVDFSIGHFQMRVSFVEQLEESICKSKHLSKKYENLVTYEANSEKELRQIRVGRIKNFSSQIRLSLAFYDLLEEKFSVIVFQNEEEKIRFYATCYNAGFDKSIYEIEQYLTKRSFPYGAKYDMNYQFNYADFSMHYYKEIHQSIF